MTQHRAHRAALTAEQAARELERDAAAGRLDVEFVRATVTAAGRRRPRVDEPGRPV